MTLITGDSPLLAEIQARYQAAREHASRWREPAREEFRFYAGEQWDEADTARMEEQQRPVVTFNRVMRLVNAVIGHEANNRAEVRYIPRTPGDARVNELLTSASAYFRDACDAEFEESDAFRDMIICGMGWTHDRLSDAQNPEYDLIEERVDPLEMLWDPSSQKPNLADARYLFRRKRYTEKEIKAIWPDFSGPFSGGFEDDDDGEPVDRSPRASYQGDGDGKDVQQDVLVLEYQYKEREAYYVAEIRNQKPETVGHQLLASGLPASDLPDTIEIPAGELTDELRDKLKERGVPFAVKRRTITRRCFVIGQSIVQGPDVVCPHDFTYHCITGFRDRERHHWFGIVRMLKDPQRWSNKWLAQIMHILNSNAKGGLMAEESAVADRHAFEASWADPAAVTWFADGALKDRRVEPKPPPTYPQGVDRLLHYANTSFTDVSGVNQELLGLADREQPGVLEWQRKQSAVTLLAPLFDSLRRFRKMQGRCWLYMMQKYVSDGRVIRITTDAGAQNVPFGGPQQMQHPQWQLPETAAYDVIVDQAPSAPNQKEQTWAVLTQLFPVLKDVLPPQMMMLAVEYSPLPESFVARLKEMQQQLQAQAQAQGPRPDPEMLKLQAQIEARKAELAMRQQEAVMTAEIERQKAEAQMRLDLAKARNDMEVQRFKAQARLEIERERTQVDAALAAEKRARASRVMEDRPPFAGPIAGGAD